MLVSIKRLHSSSKDLHCILNIFPLFHTTTRFNFISSQKVTEIKKVSKITNTLKTNVNNKTEWVWFCIFYICTIYVCTLHICVIDLIGNSCSLGVFSFIGRGDGGDTLYKWGPKVRCC